MKCPYCGESKSGVVDSRDTDDGNATRRRRHCAGCGRRFTTYERFEERPLVVIKKDGRRQMFDREKLRAGIQVACLKRPVPTAAIDHACADIERRAMEMAEREVSAHWFGEQIMAALRTLDHVAYVRFASVYRSFRDIDEFAREVELLRRPPKEGIA